MEIAGSKDSGNIISRDRNRNGLDIENGVDTNRSYNRIALRWYGYVSGMVKTMLVKFIIKGMAGGLE